MLSGVRGQLRPSTTWGQVPSPPSPTGKHSGNVTKLHGSQQLYDEDTVAAEASLVLNKAKPASPSPTAARRPASLPAAGSSLPFVHQGREQSCCTAGCHAQAGPQHGKEMGAVCAEAPSPSSQADQEQPSLERWRAVRAHLMTHTAPPQSEQHCE